MKRNQTLIIAEAGVNHNGQVDIAFKLCDAAKKAGADVVKFQTWITEEIITRDVAQADYQIKNTGVEESQYDMLKRLELSFDDFRKIKEYCDKIGIAFSSTADEGKSLDFLVELGIPFVKIGSGDIGNVSFLRYAGAKGLPVILSTGMSTTDDVRISVEALLTGGAKDITLLHCTTNYPCPYEDVNLNAMNTLAKEFGCRIGYSDHTEGCQIPWSAVAMGASVIEKHFTLDRSMEGPDHVASTEPDEFKKMVQGIRDIEKALGNGEKVPTAAEKDISRVVTKRIVANCDIRQGSIITESSVAIKRSSKGALARDWDKVIGKVASRDYVFDEGIE